MRCFVHFDLQMCFSPQRRTIFEHPNFKKWSRTLSFLTFWLPNVLFATVACNFSTSEQTKVVQTCGVLYILTFKCAFRHSGVQFFDIWTDKSAPNPSCFVHFDFQMCFSPQRRAIFDFSSKHMTSAPAALTGLLFDWPDTRIIEKTQHFATSLTFGADVSSFFWLSDYCIFCRLTWLYCWLHLLFNSPYCRKFLFKLPSIIIFYPTISPDSATWNCFTYTFEVVQQFSNIVDINESLCWSPQKRLCCRGIFSLLPLITKVLKLALDELSTLLLPWLQERLRWDGTRCENTIAYDIMICCYTKKIKKQVDSRRT